MAETPVQRALSTTRLALGAVDREPLYAQRFLLLAHGTLNAALVPHEDHRPWVSLADLRPEPLQADPDYPELQRTAAEVLARLGHDDPPLRRLQHLTLEAFGTHERFAGLLGALMLLSAWAAGSPSYTDLRAGLSSNLHHLQLIAESDVTSRRVADYLRQRLRGQA